MVIFAIIIDHLTTFVAFFLTCRPELQRPIKVVIIATLIVNFSNVLANNQSIQVEKKILQGMWHILPDARQMCFLSAFFSTVHATFPGKILPYSTVA